MEQESPPTTPGPPEQPPAHGLRPTRPTRQMVLRRITLWLGLCSLSASPSLTTSLSDDDFGLGPQLLGILTFAVLAGVLSSRPPIRRLTSPPRVRNALLISYAIRTIAAALPMVLVFPDLFVGLFAVLSGGLVIERFFPPSAPAHAISQFMATYLLVLWQGVLLNLVVGALAFVVWLFQVSFMPATAQRSFPSPSDGGCPICRYDLRQTAPGQPCPECGKTKVARCGSCDRRIDSGGPGDPCPRCGSHVTYDPRHRSWIDQIPPVRLGLLTAAAMIWTTGIVYLNRMVVS